MKPQINIFNMEPLKSVFRGFLWFGFTLIKRIQDGSVCPFSFAAGVTMMLLFSSQGM